MESDEAAIVAETVEQNPDYPAILALGQADPRKLMRMLRKSAAKLEAEQAAATLQPVRADGIPAPSIDGSTGPGFDTGVCSPTAASASSTSAPETVNRKAPGTSGGTRKHSSRTPVP